MVNSYNIGKITVYTEDTFGGKRKQRGDFQNMLYKSGQALFSLGCELRFLLRHANRKVLICQVHAVSLGTDV